MSLIYFTGRVLAGDEAAGQQVNDSASQQVSESAKSGVSEVRKVHVAQRRPNLQFLGRKTLKKAQKEAENRGFCLLNGNWCDG